jgi:hypothetical protein
MVDDRPAWARRMTNERKARGWSQAEAVRAMRAHAPSQLPSDASLLRQWKRWEAGEVEPKEFYQPIIAETFGTVTHAMFPVPPQRDAGADVLAMAGMDTLELVSRLQRSDLDQATLDGLRIMADRLCSEYPFMPPDQLLTEGRAWLRRMTALQGQRVTLRQHREILVQAGWVALLVGCVEYDTGNRHAAETTRQAALSLGTEADHGEIIAWAHEMRAWINLTGGDYHGVVAATRAGTEVTPHSSVAVQLAAQEAKAWARIGDRRQTEVALDRGRRLLESMPYPETWITTSWWTPPSSTSTPWIATGCWPMTRWPGTWLTRSSRPAPTSTGKSVRRCVWLKPGSLSAWSQPARETSTARSTRESALSTASVSRCRRF